MRASGGKECGSGKWSETVWQQVGNSVAGGWKNVVVCGGEVRMMAGGVNVE